MTAGRVAASKRSLGTTSIPASGSNRPGRTSTVRLPRPRSRASSSRRSPSSGVEATSAAPTAAATARSRPSSTSARDSARDAPSSASARAAGGSPSRSAIARSSAAARASATRARSTSPASTAGGASRTRVEQRLRGLPAELEPLARAPQPVERRSCTFASAGRLGQRLLRPTALRQQAFERFLGRPPLGRVAGPAARCLLDLRSERQHVERRDPGAQAGDLDAELLGALGGGRLQRQRPQPLRHLGLDVASPLDLRRHPCELQLRAVTPPLELPEARRLLDECPPLLGLRGQDRLHPPLRDDRAHRRAEADVGEELDDVRAAHVGAVDEVLALAAAVQAAHDRDLGEIDLG